MNLKNVQKMFKAFFLALVFVASSASILQAQQISLNFKEAKLRAVLTEISKVSDYNFVYSETIVNSQKSVSISYNGNLEPLSALLDKIFAGTNIVYQINGKQVALSLKSVQKATQDQNKKQTSVKGRVRDDKGELLVGVTVQNNNTGAVTATDIDGLYEINASKDDLLIFSFIGMKSESALVSNKDNIDVKMELDAIALSDIVVTGYQTLSKERATGSFAVVTSENLGKKLQTDIMSRMEGMAAGLTSYKGDLQIRGVATIYGNKRPLYVVDGVPFEGDLNAINPSEIANITVLKDATAASIYGARSANGVIVISTRNGGQKSVIEYNGSVVVRPYKDNRDYLDRMSSSEFVDFQQELFNTYHTPYANLNKRYSLNEVTDLLYKKEQGLITDQDFSKGMDTYRNRDNYNQLKDAFLRTNISHQHNLSIRGGAEKYQYSASINYLSNNGYNTNAYSDRIGYNLKSTFNFFSWLQADIAVLGSMSKSTDASEQGDYRTGFDATKYTTGIVPSYRMLFNEQGEELSWMQNKSQYEIDRLKSKGLNDETFYPFQERNRAEFKNKLSYNNINVGLNFNIIEGLRATVRYQTEMVNGLNTKYYAPNSYAIRTKVNNATKISPVNGEITKYIPDGGYINESRSDKNSYTLRAQIDYFKTLNNKHTINAIVGAERRQIHSTSTFVEKYGYDKVSLAHKYLDENVLNKTIEGTESVGGSYTHYYGNFPDTFGDREDRYVSFYGNASYTYNQKYALTAGIRMDQSNLFGTDPKFQYKPLWSVGLSWYMNKENFLKEVSWVNQLALRATYGINGNIAKDSGPYMIAYAQGPNSWTGEYSSSIQSPPNSALRWERTKQLNIGIDFSLLNNRLGGSIEYYSKNTSDLLGYVAADPTSGWNELLINYASMYNRGVELVLNSVNIQTKDFSWTTGLNFSYNKNMVTNLENGQNSVHYYINSVNTRAGMPMGTLYSIRYAGLDEKGSPLAYKADGVTKVNSTYGLEVADLINEGTSVPPYAASMINNFSYKGFDLSFMFVFYGGHVMRDYMPRYLTNSEVGANLKRADANYWKKPEDSMVEGMAPAFKRNASESVTNLWYAADTHIKKADYIKLKDINIGYTFSGVWLKKAKLSSLRINAQIENVWWYGAQGRRLHPEFWSGTSLNTAVYAIEPTTISFGLNVKF